MDDLIDPAAVFFLGNRPDATALAAADMEFQAGPELAAQDGVGGDFEVAGAQGVHFVEEIHHVARVHHAAVGPEIAGAVLHHAARQEDLGEFVPGHADPGVGLGVLEQDVVAGLVLLDEVVLQQQGVGLGVHHAVLGVGDLAHQDAGLGVEPLRRHEILRHPLVQVLGLAHIDHIPRGVIIAIDTRGMREQCYFFSYVQWGLRRPAFADVLAAQVIPALEDGAVLVEQAHVRNALDAVEVGRAPAGRC